MKNYNNFGFIILRHVLDDLTNKYWIHCYECIRKYYPYVKIIIIDDNSDYKYVTKKKLHNTYIINSYYKRRGELLPYYYYSRKRFFDTAIIIHDSVFINSYIDLRSLLVKKCKILWNFEHHWDNPEEEIRLIKMLKNKDLLRFYKAVQWMGCFGCMTIMNHDFLKYINQKYNLDILINYIFCRLNRMCFERILGTIIYKEITDHKPLFGDINRYVEKVGGSVNINWFNKNDFNLPIIKIWSGR